MKLFDPVPCTNCGTVVDSSQWWGLSNYYGISGRFCSACYDLVSHDSYGNPRYPEAYEKIFVAQRITKRLKP